MQVFSSYYDKVPELNQNAYTLVRISRAESSEWFSDTIGAYVDLSDAFGPTNAMLEECHPAKNWEGFEPRCKDEILGVLDKAATLRLLNKICSDHGTAPCSYFAAKRRPKTATAA